MPSLQYKHGVDIILGGYPEEDKGVSGGLSNWTDAKPTGAEESNLTYYYRDSYYMQNARSSKVNVDIKESWTWTLDDENNATVTVEPIIMSINRVADTGDTGPGTRNIRIYDKDPNAGGAQLYFSVDNDPIQTTHTILGSPLSLGKRQIYVPAGTSGQITGTIFYKSMIPGQPDAEPYSDWMWMGTLFRNVAPPGYRPGMTYNNGQWYSHNRTSGAANIRTPSGYATMLTTRGGVGTTDPPYIRYPSGNVDMRKIGIGA